MLVYVARMVLTTSSTATWKDPQGYNFPQTINFLPEPRACRGCCPGCARTSAR